MSGSPIAVSKSGRHAGITGPSVSQCVLAIDIHV